MKLKSLFPLYFAVVLAVPGAMIYCHETVLKTGEPYLFQTRPVDPYDLFRGRYVALAFEQDQVDYKGPDTFENREKVYAILSKDDHGWARIENVSRTRPKQGDYLKVRVAWHETSRWLYDEKTQQGKNVAVNVVHLILPLNRFYMNEKKAPLAEELYRKHSAEAHEQKKEMNAFARIRVLRGNGIIENLFLDGKTY